MRTRSQLFRSNDLNALGVMANAVRERKNGNCRDLHSQPLHQLLERLHPLLPVLRFWRAKKRDAHAFELRIDDIVAAVREALALGITEVHMVGGLHPTLKKDWYLDLLRAAPRARSRTHHQGLYRDRDAPSGAACFQNADPRDA